MKTKVCFHPTRSYFRALCGRALTIALLLAGALAPQVWAQTFTPGDVYWAPSLANPNPPVMSQHRLLKVNGGGDLSATTATAILPDRVYGQMAFSADRTLAYVPSYFINRVLTVTPGGVVNEASPFATGIDRPRGLLRVRTGTHAGKLLCASFADDRVYDITAGGDFTSSSAFCLSTPSAHNLVQLQDGTILVATSNGVRNITTGGVSTSYATGFSGRDLVETADGTLYVTTSTGTVLDITGGGDFTGATPFANGQVFNGLAIDELGRLLAVVSGGSQTSAIYDITAGGNFSAATPFATGLPGETESFLDQVPGDALIVTTVAASPVFGSQATLNGTVNPGQLASTAYFEYGLTPALGSTSATTSIAAGGSAMSFSKVVTGLTPLTQYYFRARAFNIQYDSVGATLTFTTGPANTPPDAEDDSVHPAATLSAFTINVLVNDSDPEGPVTVTAVGTATNGTTSVTAGGGSVTYTPGVGYTGNDTFTYTISDGAATDTATVTLHNATPVANDDSTVIIGTSVEVDVLANDTDSDAGDDAAFEITATTNGAHGTVTTDGDTVTYTLTSPFANSDSFTYTMTDGRGATDTATVTINSPYVIIASSGSGVSGETAVNYKKFGIPSIAGSDLVAFKATATSATGTRTVIVAGNPPVVVFEKGDAAPSPLVATVSNFKDPVLAPDGSVAFLATLSGSGLTSANNKAILTNLGGAGFKVVAQNGTGAPAIAGATLKSIKSIAMTNSAVFYTGVLATGGGVTTNNDVVLWSWKPVGGNLVLLREGDSVDIGGGTMKPVTTFKALTNVSYSPGHGRTTSADEALVHVTLDDGKQAIVKISATGVETVEAVTGGSVPGDPVGAKWSKFGVPARNASGDYAFLGTMQTGLGGITSANSIGVFAGSTGGGLDLVAQKGDVADIDGAKFSAFKDPVFNNGGAVAFTATLSGTGLSAANNTGIWWDDGSGLDLVARAGEPAEGTSATWSKFKSLALPASMGPVFTAQLTLGGAVTKLNNFGLWAVDGTGDLNLLQRTSDTLTIASGVQTIKQITVIGTVSASPGQGRAYNTDRAIIYRVSFANGEQAIIRVQLPSGS